MKKYIVSLHIELPVEAESENEALVLGAEHFQQRSYDCSDLSVNEDATELPGEGHDG